MQENQIISDQSVSFVRLSRIVVGLNPRTYFDEAAMKEMVDSVERVLRKTGLLKALSRAQWMP